MRDESGGPGPRPVGSVVQALTILRYLASGFRSERVTTIARETGIGASSCFNVLRTLAAEQFVDFDSTTKLYSLGVGPLDLTREMLSERNLFRLLRPQLATMSERWGSASTLWQYDGRRKLVLLGFTECYAATRIHLELGQRVPRLAGAMGLCIASGLPDPVVKTEFALLKPAGQSAEEFKIAAEQAREQGWAIDDGLSLKGVTTVAAAVRDGDGEIRFTVGNTMFVGQHATDELRAIGEDTRDFATRVARRLFRS